MNYYLISYLDISEINEDEHKIVLSRKLSFSEIEKEFIDKVFKNKIFGLSSNEIVLIKK
jgi:hypothetical protein